MTLRSVLTQARTKGTSAFIPFIMAGDPDMALCEKIILALQEAGVDALELGIPFSDPAADGVTVQRAAERALAGGCTVKDVLYLVRQVRRKGATMPICLFSYLNPIYKMGYAAFVKEALAAGANGALIVDLPPEEAGDYCKVAKAHHFETVFLCSPTTTPDRLKLIDESSSGFVYYVSREGVTGAQSILSPQLQGKISSLRNTLANPVAVGFGISTPEHIRQLDGHADGIVIGSALVRLIEENPQGADRAITQKVRELKPGRSQ
jgi:tryptophan synthase alpha chain